MSIWSQSLRRTAFLTLVSAVAAVALVACGDDNGDSEATPTQAETQVATSAPTEATTAAPTAAPTEATTPAATAAAPSGGLDAPTGVTISLDGQMDDWADVPGMEVPLTAIPEEFREEPTAAGDVTATLKVATDGDNIYVLVAIPDGFSYDPENRHLSAALGVMWQIDEGATPQMGATGSDLTDTSGMVDIWHWELDCGPGELSGGVFPTGNDPDCNLDDEYATLTDEREDDDVDSSLTGSWDHTGRAQGANADGIWVFEIARPLNTGDPQDAQFALGSSAKLSLAYWDGNEGAASEDGGWTDAGHAVSVAADEGLDGWIEIRFAN